MSAPLRIARLEDLPPGKGKLVQLGARDIAVYNLEGRYYATGTHRPHIGACELPGHASSTVCGPHGLSFDATAPDSPARGTACADSRYQVDIEGDFLVLYIEDPAAD